MYGTNYLFEEAALIKLLPTECKSLNAEKHKSRRLEQAQSKGERVSSTRPIGFPSDKGLKPGLQPAPYNLLHGEVCFLLPAPSALPALILPFPRHTPPAATPDGYTPHIWANGASSLPLKHPKALALKRVNPGNLYQSRSSHKELIWCCHLPLTPGLLGAAGSAPAEGPPHEGCAVQVTWDFGDLQPQVWWCYVTAITTGRKARAFALRCVPAVRDLGEEKDHRAQT